MAEEVNQEVQDLVSKIDKGSPLTSRETREVVFTSLCKRYGLVKANCWKRARNKPNYAGEEEEEIKLFMAQLEDIKVWSDVWFMDSAVLIT